MKRQLQEEDSLTLPDEIWYTIFMMLECERTLLLTMFVVCKRWSAVIQREVTRLNYHIPLSDVLLGRVPRLNMLLLPRKHLVTTNGLRGLTALKSLVVSRSEPALVLLANLTNLTSLTDIDRDGGNTMLPPSMPYLQSLSLLHNKHITDAALLSVVSTLKSLRLDSCLHVSPECVAQLTRLQSLDVSFLHPYDADKMIRGLTANLESLRVESGQHLSDATLSKCTRLVRLDLHYSSDSLTGESFLNLSSLTRLTIRGAHKRDNKFVSGGVLPASLRMLSLCEHSRKLMRGDETHLTALEVLDLYGTLVTRSSWLTHFPKLRELYVFDLLTDKLTRSRMDDQLTIFEGRVFDL